MCIMRIYALLLNTMLNYVKLILHIVLFKGTYNILIKYKAHALCCNCSEYYYYYIIISLKM